MKRAERRLFRIIEALGELELEEAQVREELAFHRHLDDDAQRDAAVGDTEDRALAYETRRDVARFEKALERLQSERDRLFRKRQLLIDRLPDL